MNSLWYFGVGIAYIAISVPMWFKRNLILNLNDKNQVYALVKTDIAMAVLFEIWATLKFFGIEGSSLILVNALLLAVPIFTINELMRSKKNILKGV